ncbi:hypothetical protein ABND49_02140 [Paenibacillus larvae]
MKEWQNKKWTTSHPISEKNVYLITYGDSIYEEGVPTLVTLQKFLSSKVGEAVTDVHLLPMFPYTSDDGFSVSQKNTGLCLTLSPIIFPSPVNGFNDI